MLVITSSRIKYRLMRRCYLNRRLAGDGNPVAGLVEPMVWLGTVSFHQRFADAPKLWAYKGLKTFSRKVSHVFCYQNHWTELGTEDFLGLKKPGVTQCCNAFTLILMGYLQGCSVPFLQEQKTATGADQIRHRVIKKTGAHSNSWCLWKASKWCL